MTVTTPEAEAANNLAALSSFVKTDLPMLRDTVKTVQSLDERLKALNGEKIVDEMAKQAEQIEQLKNAYRSDRNGLYVPGMESEAKHFNVLNVVRAVRMGGRVGDPSTHDKFAKCGAARELDLLKAVEKNHGDEIRLRTQLVGDDSLGGAWIPDQMLADPILPIYRKSPWFALNPANGTTRVRVLAMNAGGQITIPVFLGGTTAEWIGETETGPNTGFTVGSITTKPRKAGCYLPLSEDMVNYGGPGLNQLLMADLEQALQGLLDWTIPYGTGTDHTPRGITKTDGIRVFRAEDQELFTSFAAIANEAAADWDGGELGFDELGQMDLALEEDNVLIDDAAKATISSPRYFHRLRTAKLSQFNGQTSEKGYLLGMPMISEQALRAVIGDFGKSTLIPSNAKPGASVTGPTDSTNLKYTDVFRGDFSEVLFMRWGGVQIVDDRGMGEGFKKGITYVRVRMHADVRVRQHRKIIVCPDAKVRD